MRPFTTKPDQSQQAVGETDTREAWRLADIKAGLQDAKRGDFASDAEVATTIAKFTNQGLRLKSRRSPTKSSS